MSNPTVFGYLERPYLSDAYLVSVGLMAYGMQATLVIAASLATGEQAKANIANFPDAVGEQVKAQIANVPAPFGMQAKLVIAAVDPLGEQAALNIANRPGPYGEQTTAQIANALQPLGAQTQFVIPARVPLGMQIKAVLQKQTPYGMQASGSLANAPSARGSQLRHDNFSTWCLAGYLERPYLMDPYLTCIEGAQFGAQAKAFIVNRKAPYGMQVRGVLNAAKPLGAQTKLVIAAKKAYGMQAQAFGRAAYGMQVTFVLYNTTNLRIMDVFPSRGLDGLSWTASSTASGDFSANNLNTDIVEQQWRSAPGDVAGLSLTCDTQVTSVFVDTLVILNHNFTTSAVVVVEGSNDPGFGTVGVTFGVEILRNIANAYYIAPFLPGAGFRYWRVLIDDPTNTQGQIKIGTILFGPSIIFQGDNITDNVTRKMTHFADKVQTEGFTDVMNDRALKYGVNLEFKNLYYTKGNYQQLDQVFQYVRTSLKALWIPDPTAPERFAVFAKLKQIPDSVHNVKGRDIDFVDLNVELDESL